MIKENEALKKEVERLRKLVPPPSVLHHAAPTASILKSPTSSLSVSPASVVSLGAAAEKLEACNNKTTAVCEHPLHQPSPLATDGANLNGDK